MFISKYGVLLGIWLSLCSFVLNGHQLGQENNQVYSVYVGSDNHTDMVTHNFVARVKDLHRQTSMSMMAYVNSAEYQQRCLEHKRLLE